MISLLLRAFFGAFLALGAGRRAALCCCRAVSCAFLLVFSLLLRAFLVPFWPWVLGAVLLFLPSGFFVAVLACVFSSFLSFFGAFLALGAGRRAALSAVGLFLWPFWLVFSLLLLAFL